MKQKAYTFLSGGKIDTLESFNALPTPQGNSSVPQQDSLASQNIKTDNISVQIPVSGPSDAKAVAPTDTTVAPTAKVVAPEREWGNDLVEPEWNAPTSKNPEKDQDEDQDEDHDEDEEDDEEDDYFNIIIELLRKIDRNTRKRKKNTKNKKKKHGGRRTRRTRRTRRKTKKRTKR